MQEDKITSEEDKHLSEEDKHLQEIEKQMEKLGHREELVDHYWGSINYVFSLIRASEVKAGLILSFYGILLNLIYRNIGDVIVAAEGGHMLIYLPLGLWIFCTAASIYYSIRCFMPRMETNYDKNIFFFKDVVSKFGGIKQFSRTFYKISLSERELFDQLGQQVYINSKIAGTKFRYVNRAIYFLALSLIMLFIIGIWYMVISI